MVVWKGVCIDCPDDRWHCCCCGFLPDFSWVEVSKTLDQLPPCPPTTLQPPSLILEVSVQLSDLKLTSQFKAGREGTHRGEWTDWWWSCLSLISYNVCLTAGEVLKARSVKDLLVLIMSLTWPHRFRCSLTLHFIGGVSFAPGSSSWKMWAWWALGHLCMDFVH